MPKNTGIISRNPLRIIHHKSEKTTTNSSFGAILAQAGNGKTAFVVQSAVNTILKNKKVLHISIDKSVDVINEWYVEITKKLNIKNKEESINEVLETIQHNRLIMTFKSEEFSFSKLEKKFNDLFSQNIFQPKVIIIDGLTFDKSMIKSIQNLKEFCERKKLNLWFTAVIYKSDKFHDTGLPLNFIVLEKFFDDIILLQSERKKIYIRSIKSNLKINDDRKYFIDPSTMLIKY